MGDLIDLGYLPWLLALAVVTGPTVLVTVAVGKAIRWRRNALTSAAARWPFPRYSPFISFSCASSRRTAHRRLGPLVRCSRADDA
jgi:hypothetical protein